MGFWQKLKKIYMGDVFGSAISEADEAFFDDLEEMLILADVGLETATEVVKELRQRMIEDKISGQEPVKACLREILAEKLQVGDGALNISTRPSVVLVVGVNGVGKTTSIGKLANSLRRGPRRGALRRPPGRQGPGRGRGDLRHRRAAPQQGQPDGGAGQAAQDH